jgi:hypothetical protein
MILKLLDKIEIIITDEQAKKISNELMDNNTDNPFIFVNNQAIKKTAIAGIFKGGMKESDLPNFNHKQIAPPKYNCVSAGTSIQIQVRKIILAQHPKDWPKYLKDESYREKIRKSIRAKYPNKQWCDHREGEHACVYDSKGWIKCKKCNEIYEMGREHECRF